MIKLPEFNTKKELFAFLVENKDSLIAQKKAVTKEADACTFGAFRVNDKGVSLKANEPVSGEIDEHKVRVVINTTNLMDSHSDVHLPGIWNQTLKQNKGLMHLQEHKMGFSTIIADGEELRAYTKTFTWAELGFDYEGTTEALVFESTLKSEGQEPRNPYMQGQYAKGFVKNHSVAMRYVQIKMAINDPDYKEEKAVWDEWIDEVANKEEAEAQGYFWAVREAKAIEGSAVPRGSNFATPTLDNNINAEPSEDTQQEEPLKDTHIDVKEYLSNHKILKG